MYGTTLPTLLMLFTVMTVPVMATGIGASGILHSQFCCCCVSDCRGHNGALGDRDSHISGRRVYVRGCSACQSARRDEAAGD